MKSTGVIRRIDDLGRIVIPKEIRKSLRIHDGENLEIFIENENRIVLQKFSLMNKITDFAQSFTDSINAFIKKNVVITDTDNIIAFTGEKKKQFINQPISKQLDDYIQRRENILEKHQKELSIIEGDGIECTYTINTIVANGDALGLVIIFSEEEKTMEIDERIVQIAAQFLSKYLED
ncbi:MAG: stage V sporulation T C-terminal domain-containing protein [Bacilli bacterium]